MVFACFLLKYSLIRFYDAKEKCEKFYVLAKNNWEMFLLFSFIIDVLTSHFWLPFPCHAPPFLPFLPPNYIIVPVVLRLFVMQDHIVSNFNFHLKWMHFDIILYTLRYLANEFEKIDE